MGEKISRAVAIRLAREKRVELEGRLRAEVERDAAATACLDCAEKDARIAVLEAENERLRKDLAVEYECANTADDALLARAESAESALAAKKAECERLRTVFPRILKSLGNGAACSTDVSLEFIEQIPDEVRLELAARAADPGRVDIREPVLWFAARMERKLRENDHKGGWRDCKIGFLVKRMHEEIDEMCNAHVVARMDQKEGTIDAREAWERVVDEAADVANFAMMVADQARAKKEG